MNLNFSQKITKATEEESPFVFFVCFCFKSAFFTSSYEAQSAIP